MKKILVRTGIALLILVITGLLAGGLYIHREFEKLESDDPLVWEPAIGELTREDSLRPHPEDAVLFVGSSSIRFWSTLEQDMEPIPVIKRGYGGAKLSDVIYYADRIIWPYKPTSIVLFAGTNDITGRENDKTPEELVTLFAELVTEMERKLPGTILYYLPITPTSARREIWPEADRANRLVRQYASTHSSVVYIDTTPHFFNDDGTVNTSLLFWDGIHLNRKGYAVWTGLLRSHLLDNNLNHYSRAETGD